MTRKMATLVLPLLLSAAAAGQERPAPPAPAPTATPAAATASKSFELGAQIRFRADATESLDLSDARDDRDALVLSRVRLFATFRHGAKLAARVELQDSRTFGGETSTTSNERNVDLRQGWLRIGDEKAFLRLGRQELAWGEQRLVGTFDWDNVGRAFDGALGRAALSKAPVVLDAFWTKVKESAGPPERNDVTFCGLHATWKATPQVGVDGYLLYLDAGERNAAGDDREVVTFGARGHGTHGRLVWDAEAAWQSGHEYAQDRRAWAAAGYVRWELPAPLRPSFGLDASTATGDGDPFDGKHEEFDNLFPTNHLKYGYLDLIGWRNQRVVSVSVGVAGETTKWTARLFLRKLALAEAAGAWKSAGGAVLGRDPAGASGRDVGTEIDLVGAFPVLPGLLAQLQAGWFKPGGFAKAVRGGDDALGASLLLTYTY